MKKCLFLICVVAATSNIYSQDLNGVTFGFGAGYSHLQNDVFDYSLTTDTSHFLQQQALSKGSVVISSIVTVKFGQLKIDNKTKKLVNAKSGTMETHNDYFSRFSINLALNLAELNSGNVSFNKNIDGGLGIGYFLTDNVQLAAFYDIQRVRQLRDYIVNDYLGKRIPNGVNYYNALDPNDNSLFYNKTFTDFSLKLIISLANKKAS